MIIKRIGSAYDRVEAWQSMDWSTYEVPRTGTADADTMFGHGGRDHFEGFGSNDTFVGNGGVDIFDGGAGKDTVDYSNVAEGTRDAAGRTGVSVNLTTGQGGEVNTAVDTYISIENVKGSNFNDLLVGNGEANKLEGMGGDDVIQGGAGGDTLNGGTGFDTLVYTGSAQGVTINLTTNLANGGDATGDTISEFEHVIGSSQNDTITGNLDNNVIEGGAGRDTMSGGERSAGFDGNDMLSYKSSNAGVTVNLETGAASGGHATGDVFSNFEHILGSAYGDTLTGSALDNILLGGGGDDTLDGRRGQDTIDGGAGNDTMTGGIGLDTFTFNFNDTTGTDRILDFNAFEDTLQIDIDGAPFYPTYDWIDPEGDFRGDMVIHLGGEDTVTLVNISFVDSAAVATLADGIQFV